MLCTILSGSKSTVLLRENGPLRPPEYRHQQVREPLWMDVLHNPFWVHEESRRSNGELCAGNARGKDHGLNACHREFHNCTALLDLIKLCGRRKDLLKGGRIHADMLKRGLPKDDIYVGTALLDMYAKCGELAKAQVVFEELPIRDVALWNALIAGYAQHGLGDEALNCFEQMQLEGVSPDAITFVCILKACGGIGATEKGEEIHAEVSRQGLLDKNIVLGTALVDMYARCGALSKAQEVFDELPARDVASWTVLITAYAEHGLGDEAVKCFGRMRGEGLAPDATTFVCILKACGSIGAAEKGAEIHAEVGRQGLLRKNVVLGTALVDMYAKCGAIAKAKKVFDELPVRDVVSWNVLIAGYTQHGLGDEAVNCFGWMQDEGLSPNAATFVCILKACGSIGAAEKGEEIHATVSRQGLLEKHSALGSALVDMYAKCGALAKAQQVFDELPVRDVASWNALMAGYAQHGLGDEAVKCFGQVRDEGLSPDAITFVCILNACGSIGATEKGEEICAEVSRRGLAEGNIVLSIALVDMYAKCGALVKAQDVFDRLPARDVVSWTAVMAGYAQFGKVERVFDAFRKMIGEYIEPNSVTFVVLLNACSHAGLVKEAQIFYESMNTVYSIIPTLEHHTCMLDLFSRAGHFDMTMHMNEKVPLSDCLQLWLALLGACRKWVNVEAGRWAFEHAVQVDEKYDAVYVCMGNIYAAAGMQEEANKVEALRMKNKAWRTPVCCWWTDVSRTIHSFTVGDTSHPQSKHIYAKLKEFGERLPLEKHVPGLPQVSQAISDDRNEDLRCEHNGKLAIACALINTPVGMPIRVTKNVRICSDCHFATSIISMIEKRKIQVKDANRIHIFEVGRCICEEQW